MGALWHIGIVPIATADGIIGIPGWVGDVFGLDWRPNKDRVGGAYVVTHLATGWGLFAICANLETVQEVAEQLAHQLDWSGQIDAVRDRIVGRRTELKRFIARHDGRDPGAYTAPPGDHVPFQGHPHA